MNTVIVIVAACLYGAGVIIAAGDALVDEHTEREQAHNAKLDAVRVGSLARVHAARRRLRFAWAWPVLLVQALWRLRHETRPRHVGPTPRHHR